MAQPRYQVLERIDAGGMAEVFKAESTSMQGFGKLVAIKRVLPDLTKNERFVRMFLDEAKVSLRLNHTNCVQVFDLGIADGTYFIVMEFVDGTNLKKILEHHAAHKAELSVEQVAYIALEICKGLAHAHGKRDPSGAPLEIVHRDISPPNVLVSREGEIKITDFGLAKAQSQVERTDPGVVKGKFGYLSPEAAHGREVDARTDLFAVGILIWEMLAGRRLFLGRTDYDTLRQVQAAQIPSVSSERARPVPPEIDRIVRRALAAEPAQRYATARELGEDLSAFLFQYGRPVSAFQIARLVEDVDRRASRERSIDDRRARAEVQREIDQLKMLEEIDDLDLYLARAYDSISTAEGRLSGQANEGLEDPASWALDLNIDADEAPSYLDAPGLSADWKEGGLADLVGGARSKRDERTVSEFAGYGQDPTVQVQRPAQDQARTSPKRRPARDAAPTVRAPPPIASHIAFGAEPVDEAPSEKGSSPIVFIALAVIAISLVVIVAAGLWAVLL